MIVLENKTVYVCEHCKKRMFVKNACERHEERCYSNPKNKRACTGCQFLERVQVDYVKDVMYLGENLGVGYDSETRQAMGFRCTKLDKIMYPYKVERNDIINRYPESFEGQESMPVTCEHFVYSLPF